MANTDTGKAVSARNATTHGLFCRQTVLPHLGEDPQGYEEMLLALMQGLDPRTLMERQYLELWADASWKLRRLSRWEAQVWEDDALDDDKRLAKIERLARLQTTLRRQLDKAVRMLGGQNVPDLYAQRARRAVLADKGWTETDCRRDWAIAREVEGEVLADLQYGDRAQSLDKTRLDSAPAAESAATDTNEKTKNDQNELAPAPPETENCQNEPEATTSQADETDQADQTDGSDPALCDPNGPRAQRLVNPGPPDPLQGLSRTERLLVHTLRTGDNPFRHGSPVRKGTY